MTGARLPCSLVTALEHNHHGELVLARALVDAAVASGGDAVKVPRCRVAEFYSRDMGQSECHTFPELGDTFGQVMGALELSESDLASLRDYCRGRIGFIGAPYDLASLEELAALDPEGYQIDPPVFAHIPLIRGVAQQGRPVLAVAGMCTDRDIEESLGSLVGCDVTLLHCVCAAPLPLESTALATILYLRQKFARPVGYLDLTEGSGAGLVALALGATVIEKPLTLDLRPGRTRLGGATPEQWREMAEQVRSLERSLQTVASRRLLDIELEAFGAWRVSLVAARDLPAGTVLTADAVAVKAPRGGLSPAALEQVIGKRLLYNLAADAPITFGVVEP